MRIRTAGVEFMRDNPERFIESNTVNSWLRYLNNMSIQGTWAGIESVQLKVVSIESSFDRNQRSVRSQQTFDRRVNDKN